MPRPSKVVLTQLAVGTSLILISGVLAYGAFRFPPEMGFVILSAYVYPYAVAAFVGCVGLLLSYQAITGGLRNLPDHDDVAATTIPGGKAGAAWVTVGLLGVALLIEVIGFVLAAGLLFAFSVRDLAIGIALTLPIYWLFNAGLGVSLPHLINVWI
jgi:putative tricarboxylic transport membrane protein